MVVEVKKKVIRLNVHDAWFKGGVVLEKKPQNLVTF
jgi:hypothetical protein